LIDPQSKFVLSHVQGVRDEALVRQLLTDGASRLRDRHQIALFTDGYSSYASLFPEIFGKPYLPPRQGTVGRLPHPRYRIPRTAAHVQVIKHRQGSRLKEIEIRYAHGSQKRIQQAIQEIGCRVANTSFIERRNGTARLMDKAQVRKTLAFSRREDEKLCLGWWALTVYNWCRQHRSLRRLLPEMQGKKSTSSAPRRWHSIWQIQF
jgi:IS1 family transposase